MHILLIPLLLACSGDNEPAAWTFPDVDAGPALRGPGGPTVEHATGDLWKACAFLDGNPQDPDHHNLVVPYRGHLVMPAAPEWGYTGGISLFDMSDPCTPLKVGEGVSEDLRETHAMGFVHIPEGPHAGDWAVTNELTSISAGGIQVWNLDDETAPYGAASLELPGFLYPDAYARVTLSLFVQYPWVYVAGADNGIYVVDMTDPNAPELAAQYTFDAALRAGGVFALGNRLMVSAAEGSTVALLDISQPDAPQLIPGGLFDVHDAGGEPRDFYHANMTGPYALFARKEDGGGPIIYDITDPSNPTFLVDYPLQGRSGGYIFWDEGRVFVGGSDAADVIDVRSAIPQLEGTADLTGDLDTITPWGNVAILSVDDEAVDHQGSAVVPWREDPDATGPTLLLSDPADGATGLPVTARVGLAFDEFIEPATAFEGSIRVFDEADLPVRGQVSTQENTVSWSPTSPLQPGTTYTVRVEARGVSDINLNPTPTAVEFSFTTAE